MRKVYFDNASTNPLLPEVRDAMMPFLNDIFGNPSSLHSWGDAARQAVDNSRTTIAELLSVVPEEIIFTGSGSESNNLAIKGASLAKQNKGKHIILSEIEHFSVMNSAKTLEKSGFELSYIPVDKYGTVNPDDVRKAIRKDTILVSIMHANGEVGTIQPIKEISQVTREKDIIFHTDAVASTGSIPVDVKELGVDLLSLAGNQFYGPKGIGALWVRKGVRLIPQIDGGIQEEGRRAGTENVPAIVGLAKAAEIAKNNGSIRNLNISKIRDRLLKELPTKIDHVIVTGHPENRIPGNASFCVQFVEGESMLMLLDSKGVAVTSGSACTSRALKASHVLIAMGLSHEVAQGSILISPGIYSSNEDVDYLFEVMPPIVERLRQMSPLYSKYTKSIKGAI